MMKKYAFYGVISLLAVLLVVPMGAAETVRVTSGTLDHFIATVLESPEAGKPFSVRVEAVDAFDNLITDYNISGSGINLAVLGQNPGAVQNIEASLFQGGAVVVDVSYAVAEDIIIRVVERDGRANGTSQMFTVRPGPVDRFAVSAPPAVQAGEIFTAAIVAYDRFNNVVTDYAQRARGITLETSGVGNVFPSTVSAREFINGRLVMGFKFDTAEELRLVIRDQELPVSSTSSPLRVSSGTLNRFVVTVPRAGQAGLPVTVAVEAKDVFGNTVHNYAEVGRGVELTCNGVGRVQPDFVNPDDFNQGVAFVTVTYTRAESIMIFAGERGREISGASGNISFQAGELASFEVEVPAEAEAGTAVKVLLRAVDAFGNTLRLYDRVGTPVRLQHNGSLPTGEQKIAPTAFIDGIATVDFSYRQAERLILTAKQIDGNALGISNPLFLRAGVLDHFRVLTPEQANAGQPFAVKLIAEDKFNNRINEYSRRGSEAILVVMGTASREPLLVSASRFLDGQAQVTYIYTKSEKIVMRVEDREGRVLGLSEPLFVSGGALAGFKVQAPAMVAAGESFAVTLTAVDSYDNIIDEYSRLGHGVRLSANGVGTLVPVIVAAEQFNAGIAKVDCQYYASEIISISAIEEQGLALGTSGNIQVRAGSLDHFIVTAPARVVAGEVFDLRLEAQDRYFNTLRDFARSGEQLSLTTSLAGNLIPASLSAAEFPNGVANLSLSFDRSGIFKVMVESRSGVQGLSDKITCSPNEVARFGVAVLDEIRAGEPFRLRITPEDAFGNQLPDYVHRQELIQLVTNGNGRLYPATVDPAMFHEGEAEMQAVYTRAEAVEIMARVLGPQDDDAKVIDALLVTGGGGDHFVLRLVGNGEIEYRDVRLAQPRLLIVDLPNVRLTAEPRRLAYAQGPVSLALLTQESMDPVPVARLTISLREHAAYQISRQGNIIELNIEKMPASVEIISATPLPQPEHTLLPSERTEAEGLVFPEERTVEYYLSKAEGFIRLEKYREALRQVELALRLQPNHGHALEMERRLRRLIILFH